MSARTLQRELNAAGTSFQHELRQVRLAVAEKMLLGTDAKISAIAQSVGYASDGHFSRVQSRLRAGPEYLAWHEIANGWRTMRLAKN